MAATTFLPPSTRIRRRLLATTVVAIAAASTVLAAPAAADPPLPEPAPVAGLPGQVVDAPAEGDISPSGATCRGYRFPVTMREGATEVFEVYGELCTRRPLSAELPVQILIHGGTYNHNYWDWSFEPQNYSYVEYATRRGFATLNIDRLGYGRSDHPNPLALDFRVAGHVTHQLVQYLRGGALGAPFETVALNGHSMGGLTAWHAASTYSDVDAVIATGVGHTFLPHGIAQVADKVYPAELDPAFGTDTGWLPGYLTTLPGNRARTFIEPGDYEPGIVEVEEVNKDTVSTVELASITTDSYDPSITGGIDVPVLYALGQHDLIWCPTTRDCNTDPQAQREAGYYGPDADYSQYVVPRAGHSINSNTTAPLFYQRTIDWLGEHGIG